MWMITTLDKINTVINKRNPWSCSVRTLSFITLAYCLGKFVMRLLKITKGPGTKFALTPINIHWMQIKIQNFVTWRKSYVNFLRTRQASLTESHSTAKDSVSSSVDKKRIFELFLTLNLGYFNCERLKNMRSNLGSWNLSIPVFVPQFRQKFKSWVSIGISFNDRFLCWQNDTERTGALMLLCMSPLTTMNEVLL